MLMTAERAEAMILQQTMEQYLSTERRHLKEKELHLIGTLASSLLHKVLNYDRFFLE